jgi:hypothetical protein
VTREAIPVAQGRVLLACDGKRLAAEVCSVDGAEAFGEAVAAGWVV